MSIDVYMYTDIYVRVYMHTYMYTCTYLYDIHIYTCVYSGVCVVSLSRSDDDRKFDALPLVTPRDRGMVTMRR